MGFTITAICVAENRTVKTRTITKAEAYWN